MRRKQNGDDRTLLQLLLSLLLRSLLLLLLLAALLTIPWRKRTIDRPAGREPRPLDHRAICSAEVAM